ncbi:hypothetical protein [Bosea sp. (in: a-proteobacteria)]|uniref:hypothetical protein n=1 Tax=Bosea sp. (in: a-proteobacteria) TaxID=1871050 RepID=UPI00121BE69D|nr:hypothetical protein [Bosea sp. (in: a-proteobacteria)]TAJ29949.1 MAG: hypothetical protein EPO59_13465 [Bosea sp. (in: a-proteobacteria)]
MNLKTLGIGALARALASTAVVGAVSFAASGAYAQTAAEVNTVKLGVEAVITQTIAANPNMTPEQLSAAIKVAVNAYLNDPANGFSNTLKAQALAAVRADNAFQTAVGGSTAVSGVQLALFGPTGPTGSITTGPGGGPSGFAGGPGAGAGGGGGGSGAHNL